MLNGGGNAGERGQETTRPGMASISEGLARHLGQQPGPTHTMTFPAVAATLGRALLTEPAYTRRQWWAHDRDHTQARNGWLAAGWLVATVDLAGQVVTFRR